MESEQEEETGVAKREDVETMQTNTSDLITFKKSRVRNILLLALAVSAIVAVTLGILKVVRGKILDKDNAFVEAGSGDYGPVQEFTSIKLFFELNDSDHDLGVQLSLGAEEWNEIAILNPDGKTMFKVEAGGALAEHGMSDLFFESAEPEFAAAGRTKDEAGEPLPTVREILDRFPAGTYTFLGINTNNQLIRGNATLTHNIPTAVVIRSPIMNTTVPVTEDLIVSWQAVTTPTGIEIHSYEVIVTNMADEDFVFDVRLRSDATNATVPKDFLKAGIHYELEVLAREVSGNQVISIHYFTAES